MVAAVFLIGIMMAFNQDVRDRAFQEIERARLNTESVIAEWERGNAERQAEQERYQLALGETIPRPRATATLTPRELAVQAVKERAESHEQRFVEEVEQIVYEFTNLVRPIRWDSHLASVARAHSEDMAATGHFDHVNLKGQSPTDRGLAMGYDCYKDYGSYYTRGIGENIYKYPYSSVPVFGDSSEEMASKLVDGWMASPGHRENILNPAYDRIGVGIAIRGSWLYATQNFC
ncbi:MAG: CAP domain-containing protein [Gemmatimonadota bacterium]|nr:CAP domain-containing protein [Gemmatimonadota bacterium]